MANSGEREALGREVPESEVIEFRIIRPPTVDSEHVVCGVYNLSFSYLPLASIVIVV